MKEIRKVAVIGAGVMGAGIAAQLANAGLEVELIDIVPKGAEDRDIIAKSAIEKQMAPGGGFMHADNAKRVRAGNTEDNLDRLADCDMIIEAIIENPKVKADLFKKVDAVRKPGSIVTSNTSTLPLSVLVDGQSDAFKKDFVITHFFNPPRYMPLVELVTSKDNSKETVEAVRHLTDVQMGKHVIFSNDMAGFITTRLGVFWLQCAIREAYKHGLTIEEADAVAGRPMGIPPTGVFGLADLVGLDLIPHVQASLMERLPKGDAFAAAYTKYPLWDKMLEAGCTGRKPGSKGGFYRRRKTEDGQKIDESIDLTTGVYRAKEEKVQMPCLDAARKGGLKALIESNDKGGAFAWGTLKQVLCYAVDMAEQVSCDITSVDEAMKLGYNWKFGPFEMIDMLGADYLIKRLEAEGETVPALLRKAQGKTFYRVENGKLQQMGFDGTYQNVVRAEGVLLLSDIKRGATPVMESAADLGGAKVWDIGDGVLCLEFTSKANAVDGGVLEMLEKSMDLIGNGKGKYKALVIHHEGDDFSYGANVGLAVQHTEKGDLDKIRPFVQHGQDLYKRLKYAPFPTVAASQGRAFGGACEMLLHCTHVQAYAEMNMGLIEVTAGVLPAWGGTTEMLTRALNNPELNKKGAAAAMATVFDTFAKAKVSMSAQDAKSLMYLRPQDGITMNKERLLADAKKRALELAAGYQPPKPYMLPLMGEAGHKALNDVVDKIYAQGGVLTPYDVVVLDQIARTVAGVGKARPGQAIHEDELRAVELDNVTKLLHDDRTISRIAGKLGMPFSRMHKEEKKPTAPAQELRDAFEKAASACKTCHPDAGSAPACGFGENTPKPPKHG